MTESKTTEGATGATKNAILLNAGERRLVIAALQEERVRNLDRLPETGHADGMATRQALGQHRTLTALIRKFEAFDKESARE